MPCRRPLVRLLLLILCLSIVPLAGCGPRPPVDPAPVPPPALAALPAPGAIAPRHASYTGLVCRGVERISTASNRAASILDQDGLRFSPQWDSPADPLSAAAYAVFEFNAAGYSGEPALDFNWAQPPAEGAAWWIGFSHWATGRWDWQAAPLGHLLHLEAAELASYTRPPGDPQAGQLYVALVLCGTAEAELNWIAIGPPTGTWARSWGLSDNDQALDVALSPYGEIYVAGVARDEPSSPAALLLKLDHSGAVLWRRVLGVAGGAAGCGVALDSSGQVYLAGVSNEHGSDVLLSGFSPAGELASCRRWDGDDYDFGTGICIDGSDNIYLSGFTHSAGLGGSDALALKLNSAGSLQWSKAWGGTEYEYAEDIAVDEAGAVYAAGHTRSFGAGAIDSFLLSLDATDGSANWSRGWGDSGNDEILDVAVDDNGDLWLAGRTDSFSYRGLLLQYDSSGALLLARILGLPYSEFRAIASAGERVVLAGASDAYGTAARAVLLLECTTAGAVESAYWWGGTSAKHEAWGVAVNSVGVAAVAGLGLQACTAAGPYAAWETADTGFPGSPAGTETLDAGVLLDVTGEMLDSAAELVPQAGVLDLGGGGEDVLVLRRDAS